MKLPDPPILTNGKDPKFADWASKMRAKLRANKDYYDIKELKMAYVENRTGGDAVRHLAPRLEEGENQFQTATDMLEYLETIYLDPNRQEKARAEFKKLEIKDSEEYHTFLTRFLHLANKAKILADSFKMELRDRLTNKLRKHTISSYIDMDTFAEYSKRCSQVAQDLRGMRNTSTAVDLGRTGTTYSKSTRTVTPVPRAITAGETTTTPSPKIVVKQERRTEAEQQAFRAAKRCFRCEGKGHMARDCPSKSKVDTSIKVLEKTQNAPEDSEEVQGNEDA